MSKIEGIVHFACNSLNLVQVGHIHPATNTRPSYIFGFDIYPPKFNYQSQPKHVKLKSKRYYLNQRCLKTAWVNKKIGPLWIPSFLNPEPIKLHDFLILDVKHGPKGMYGIAHLPPSWSNPIVRFLTLLHNPRRIKYVMQNQAFMEELKTQLYIKLPNGGYVTTLLHALFVIGGKNWNYIIDMFRKSEHREYDFKSFEEIRSHPLVKYEDIRIPTTQDFIMELVLWAQSPDLLLNLQKSVELETKRNSYFTDQGLEFFESIPELHSKLETVL